MTVLSGVLMCLVLASVPAGGPARTGPLTVLHDAVTLKVTEGRVLVTIPVQTHALAPQVTLKATVSLVDPDEKVRAERDVLQTVGTGPATLQLTLETTSAPEALRECQLHYRIRSMHPPAEVEGATAVASLLALEAGGPSRPGRLVVLGDAITMTLTDDGLEVAIPVQMDALAPTVTLKATVELVDKKDKVVATQEILHTMESGVGTVGLTVPTDATADELRDLRLRYRVRSLHPPGEVTGEIETEDVAAADDLGGPPRVGVLRVLEDAVSLRHTDEGLVVVVPVLAQAVGAAVTVKVTAELLDVNDTVISSQEVSHSMAPGPATVTITLPTTISAGEMLPLRLRYRVRSLHPPGEVRGTIAVSELLAVPEIIYVGEDTYLSGSRASLRVVALDHASRLPLEGSTVKVDLITDEAKELLLFEGSLDAAGTAEPVLELPAGLEGSYTLKLTADTPLGTEVIQRPITVKSRALPLLVTDKPTYQPGQTIHMRVLCLRLPSRRALAGAGVALQVRDPKGNIVSSKNLILNAMGVTASSFTLADHVTLGEYAITAAVGDESAEKTVQVERYVLPKFGIELATDRPYYQPGDELKGDVQADYFFGQPVSGGRVLVTLRKFDVATEVFQEVQGTLDEDGTFSFSVPLPAYFVGLPLEQGDAFVEAEVSVTDGADHEEKAWAKYPVTRAPLLLRVLPESGDLVVGVPNRIHVAVSYPDGAPAPGTVSVTAGEQRFWVETDELGLASFEVTVEAGQSTRLVLLATDQEGAKAGADLVLAPGEVAEGLLLRPSPQIARVGDPVTFQVLSSGPSRVAYVDLIKDGQTVLTRTVAMTDGAGTLTIVPDAGLAGTVWAHAYQVTTTGDLIRDTRVVYVDPADDLGIDVATDQEQYTPGESGRVDFSVTNAASAPVVAALGVTVVDEAVFARTEMRPGLEKVYFTLEEEILKPRFEIHGFEMPFVAMNEPPPGEKELKFWKGRQRAAEVVFASLEGPAERPVEINTFRQATGALREVFLERMARDWQTIWQARQEFSRSRRRMPAEIEDLVDAGLLEAEAAEDMWGSPYGWLAGEDAHWFQLVSLGPDKTQGTEDDLIYSGEDRVRRFKVEGAVVGVVPKAPAMPDRFAVEDFKDAEAAVTGAGAAEPRVREYFPETMVFEPLMITDAAGKAELDLKWPDSVTEWRLTASASTAGGELGSAVMGINVFQPFFVDIDLPVSLTQGDEVWVPVAVYNYLEDEQTVRLELQEEPWFELTGEATKEKLMAPGEVDFVRFPLKAVALGSHPLTVKAYGAGVSDAVSRRVEVVPDGREHVETYSDRLSGQAERAVAFPASAIEGASNLLLRVLPGVMSQVVEGLQSIFRMPFGCFEQTSSITYPNIMVLDYMRRTGSINPELEMTAEEYINLGYQRLLAYEVEGGGFEWFGNAPANLMLTAYGLMEFYDMSRVYEVDPQVLQRTGEWILSKQQDDGHWDPDPEFLHAESWGKIQRSEILPTAYALWALQRAGHTGGHIETGLKYLKKHLKKVEEPYALALCANALVTEDRQSKASKQAIERLTAAVVEDGDVAYWRTQVPTFAGARRDAADIETTALALLALLKQGGHPGLAEKALTYLIRSRDAGGTWHTTQGTVLVLQALVETLEAAGRRDAVGTLTVRVDGEDAGVVELTEENSEVVEVIDLTSHLTAADHHVRLVFDGDGECAFDLVKKYFIPWPMEPAPAQPLLDIEATFDKTELEEKDLVTQTVRVTNRGDRPAKMVLVDLGLPPGFSPQVPDLEELVGKAIQKYELTGRQVIVYLERLDAAEEVEFSYRLKARFPIRAASGVARVYEYYNPDDVTASPPVRMTVNEAE